MTGAANPAGAASPANGTGAAGTGAPYLLLRERDLHAVASARIESGQTGLYL